MAISTLRLDQLPLRQLPGNADATVPVVLGNTTAARVPLSSLHADTLQVWNNAPTDTTPAEAEGKIHIGDALYYFKNGVWNKVLSYTDNWGDITPDARALLVNTVMDLPEEHIANVFETLQLRPASEDKLGLVRAMTDEEAAATAGAPVKFNQNGTAFIEGATGERHGAVTVWDGHTGDVASKLYVDECIAGIQSDPIPVANETSLGGVLSNPVESRSLGSGTAVTSLGLFTVSPTGEVTIRAASEWFAGVVRTVDSIDGMSGGVPLVEAVRAAIDDIRNNKPIATRDEPGNVKVYTDAVAGAVYINDDELLEVRDATESLPGIVVLDSAVTDTEEKVPTSHAVKEFVEDYVELAIANKKFNIPIASKADLGAVIVGQYLTVDSTGTIDVPIASSTAPGIVTQSDTISSTASSSAASVAAVIKYAATKTELANVTSYYNQVSSAINSVKDDVSGIENSLSAVEDSVSALTARVNVLDALEINSAVATLRIMEGDVEALQMESESQQAQINDLWNAIAALEAKSSSVATLQA